MQSGALSAAKVTRIEFREFAHFGSVGKHISGRDFWKEMAERKNGQLLRNLCLHLLSIFKMRAANGWLLVSYWFPRLGATEAFLILSLSIGCHSSRTFNLQLMTRDTV
jgi:hypothetical protein